MDTIKTWTSVDMDVDTKKGTSVGIYVDTIKKKTGTSLVMGVGTIKKLERVDIDVDTNKRNV